MKAWLLEKLGVVDLFLGENASKAVGVAFVAGVLVGVVFL